MIDIFQAHIISTAKYREHNFRQRQYTSFYRKKRFFPGSDEFKFKNKHFIFLEQFQFSFVRVVAFGAAAVLVLIGSLAAWSKNEGKGTLQAAGAFGTLTGVTFGASAFFAFQMHKELQAPTPDGKHDTIG